MLSTNVIHLAIEPVTTSIANIAGLKALGLFGAAAGGAAGQVATGNKNDPVKRGTKIAAESFFRVSSGIEKIETWEDKNS